MYLRPLSRALCTRAPGVSKPPSLQALMATPQFWDSAASSGFDDSFFGYFCAQFASQLARRHSTPHRRILDVGTGTGVLALTLASKYPDAKVGVGVGAA